MPDPLRKRRAGFRASQPKRDIGLAAGQAEIARLGDHLETYLRILGEELGQNRHQHAIDEHRDGCEAHTSRDGHIGALYAELESFDLELDARGVGERGLPCFRRSEQPVLAREEPSAEGFLHGGEATGDRRLVDAGPARRRG